MKKSIWPSHLKIANSHDSQRNQVGDQEVGEVIAVDHFLSSYEMTAITKYDQNLMIVVPCDPNNLVLPLKRDISRSY